MTAKSKAATQTAALIANADAEADTRVLMAEVLKSCSPVHISDVVRGCALQVGRQDLSLIGSTFLSCMLPSLLVACIGRYLVL